MKQPPVPGARLVIDRADIDAAYARLAQAVQQIVDDGSCLLLGVLLGGLVPLARLVTSLHGDFEFETCRVGRYGHATAGGELRWLARPACPLRDRHIVVVDDIFDEGITLATIVDECRRLGARRTTSLVLVNKRRDRAREAGVAPAPPDLVGLQAGDEYLFGAGMDYQGKWRHLPDIWGLPPAA